MLRLAVVVPVCVALQTRNQCVRVVPSARSRGPATTDEWERYAQRPLRRSLALSKAGLGVLWARQRARRRERRDDKVRADEIRRRAAEDLTDRLIRLGPTYVKLGQIASNREELEGTPWARALERLQDRVPPFDSALAKEQIENELGNFSGLFKHFDVEPLAAASLGQVHRATLHSGEELAIKVQRPGLRGIYDRDAAVIRKIATAVDRFSPGWTELCEDSIRILYREIDYRREAENADRFARDFAKYAAWVVTPKIYHDLTTETVLVMEYLPGISLKRLDALEDAGLDRVGLAEKLARAYLLQFCKFGFFNTDPHAGNLAADQNGRLIVYDFGQASDLTPNQSAGILQTIEAIINMDASACVDAFECMGVLKPDYDRRAIVDVVQTNFDTGRVKTRASKVPENNNSKPNSTTAPPKNQDKKVIGYFELPASYAFVARAISQLTGVGVALDPDFDFIAASAPLLPEVKGIDTYFRDELFKRWRAFADYLGGHRDSPFLPSAPPPRASRAVINNYPPPPTKKEDHAQPSETTLAAAAAAATKPRRRRRLPRSWRSRWRWWRLRWWRWR
ncbi:hypothetical protein CTAYLR_002931 [Chrysophaeum taylorii]|uniref:ABC1 atypical kinase-like domain-containing protein n=1 Tax=Chrysophaeum taylorii TaxID=2483200 RepID=A0AAD7XR14_9STRA|nr:hypothetical protein CTAYLR_002931 [Chrysophaeum taylorii]